MNVAVVSLRMGSLPSERLLQMMEETPKILEHLKGTLESTELTGHVTWGLFDDEKLMPVSGQTLIAAELARGYGITDIDSAFAPSVRQLHRAEPPSFGSHKAK